MEIMMFKESLNKLECSLKILSDHIKTLPYYFAATVEGPFKKDEEALSAICFALTNLYYSENNEDGRFTPRCLGAVASDEYTLSLVRDVNGRKDEFQQAAKKCLGILVDSRSTSKSPAGKAKAMRSILADIGYGRLSLRQCYRHIPLVEYTPTSVRFSYSAKGKSISKISLDRAVGLLDKSEFESDSAQIDRERLSKLPSDIELAKVQDLAGYYKMNIVQCAGLNPETIPAFLPLFYLHDEAKPLIHQDVLPGVSSEKKIPRKVRSDKRLDDCPLASSIRVYGYSGQPN